MPQGVFLKHQLHQQHVANGAACYRNEHLPFPQVQADYHCDGNKLRNAVASGYKAYISQAIYDQQTEYGSGQKFAQKLYVFRCRLSGGKNYKRQKSRYQGT